MTMLNGQKAFSLEQELVAEQQETVEDDRVKDASRQRGILLLTAETEGGRFRRVIEEFLLTEEALSAVHGRDEVSLDELGRLHDEAVARRRVDLNVPGAMEVESGLTNRDVAIPPGPTVMPYEPPDEPIPIPAFVLYWPTVTPVLSEEEVKPGEGWTGDLNVQIGAGQFRLSYSVTLVEYVEDDPFVQITLDDREQVARAGEEGDVALHLKPRGSWTVRISHEDGLWEQAQGEMSFSVRARYKEDEDDEEEIEVDVLRWTNKFAVQRIPVTFDDEKIYPAEWGPEAAPAPTQADDAAGEGPGEAADSGATPSSPLDPDSRQQESGGEAEGSR